MSVQPTPEQANAIYKQILGPRRVELLSPFIVGGWLDTLFLGLIFVAYGVWVFDVRETDRCYVKGLVAYLMIVGVGSTVATLVHWDHVFMRGFGDYTAIISTQAARFIPLFFIALKVPSAAFFAMRAYNLQGRPLWFPVVVIPILLSCAVGGIIGTVYLTAFPANKIVLDCVLMDAVTAVVADLVISGTLLHGLLKSKTGWERTDRVIKRLMWILVETQAPPTLVTIGYLITAVMKPDGTAVGFFIFLPKLHVLNVMININSRIATAKQLSQPASGSHQSSGNRGKYVYGSRISSQGHRSPSEVPDIEHGAISASPSTFIPYPTAGPSSAGPSSAGAFPVDKGRQTDPELDPRDTVDLPRRSSREQDGAGTWTSTSNLVGQRDSL